MTVSPPGLAYGRAGWNRTSGVGVKVPCLLRLATALCFSQYPATRGHATPIHSGLVQRRPEPHTSSAPLVLTSLPLLQVSRYISPLRWCRQSEPLSFIKAGGSPSIFILPCRFRTVYRGVRLRSYASSPPCGGTYHGAADRNRTGAPCLEGRCSTIELQRHIAGRVGAHPAGRGEEKEESGAESRPAGAAGRARTDDLLITKQLLCQLSYSSACPRLSGVSVPCTSERCQ